jgi:hypothetical protein
MMKKEVKKEQLPKGALRFVEYGENCCAFAEQEEGKTPKLNMTAYSGKVIKGHWYWGDLVFSLDGIKMAAPKIPVLEEHYTDARIGFTSRLIKSNEEGLRVDPEKTKFLENDVANKFIKDSSEGFPFQSSVYIRPIDIQRLGPKESMEVNGFTFKGPGTVFLKSEIKEVSVCVFGWDSKTTSSAFSRKETEEIQYFSRGGDETKIEDVETDEPESRKEVKTKMDLKEMKEKHPDLVEQLKLETLEEAQEQFKKQESEWESKFNKVQEEMNKLSDRLASSDKEITISREEANQEKADRIYAEMLGDSRVPDRFHEKVKNMVRFDRFVEKDSNKLAVDKFKEALEAEIKDWEDRGVTTEVMGMGTSNREEEDPQNGAKLKEENETNVNALLKAVGQKVE